MVFKLFGRKFTFTVTKTRNRKPKTTVVHHGVDTCTLCNYKADSYKGLQLHRSKAHGIRGKYYKIRRRWYLKHKEVSMNPF